MFCGLTVWRHSLSLLSKMASPRVRIVGHSFVTRLQQFIRRNPGLSANMNLRPDQCSITFSGNPGGTIPRLRRDQLPAIRGSSPDIVVLQIGSNDLCDMSISPQTVLDSILDLVASIHNSANVHRVVVMQLLHRHEPRSRIRRRHSISDFNVYNSRVDFVNTGLMHFLRAHPFASFGKQTGLWNPTQLEAALSDDGTHLNNFVGHRKYFNNVRAAIIAALRHL